MADIAARERATLAASFTTTGDAYDRYRPGFPDAALDLVLRDGDREVLDLGAGTGKLTERLVPRVPAVTAVDPAESMLGVLRAKLPQVVALVGTAEAIPVAAGSQDVVTVAQAFHWFDEARAAHEIARVLRPGGTLALLWNAPDPRCTWDNAAAAVAHPASASARDGVDPDHIAPAAPLPGFHIVGAAVVPWHEQLSRDDYLARWNTVSSFLAATPARRARMTGEVERILREDPATAGQSMLDLTHHTLVHTYRRATPDRVGA